jgi:hypothetical protein
LGQPLRQVDEGGIVHIQLYKSFVADRGGGSVIGPHRHFAAPNNNVAME